MSEQELENGWNDFKQVFIGSHRFALAALCIIAALVGGESIRRYRASLDKLSSMQLEARGEVSGANFYAARKRIWVGQNSSRKELAEHLNSIDFQMRERFGEEGTYALDGNNKIIIASRLKEFKSAEITFNRNRVTRIVRLEDSIPVSEIEIEPPMLASFAWSVRQTGSAEESVPFVQATSPNNPARMLVRRKIVQSGDLIGGKLYYASLASEDHTFPTNNGVRYEHLLLAPFQKRGGSGITNQVSKNVINLDADRSSLSRKLNEIFMTAAVEAAYSKEQIYEMYANHVPMGVAADGYNLYGFAAGAEEYFGKKDVKAVTLSEACVLSGMLDRPNYYIGISEENPRPTERTIRYAAIKHRRDRCLNLIVRNLPGQFGAPEIEAARSEPIRFALVSRKTEKKLDVVSKPFVDYSRQNPQLENLILPLTQHSGVHVYTTTEADLQQAGIRSLGKYIADIERKHPPIDIHTGQPKKDRLLGMIIGFNPQTGEIVTLVGGTGLEGDGVVDDRNAVNAVLRPPASTYKPFALCQAIDLARTELNNSPLTAATVVIPKEARIGDWKPDKNVGEECRVRACLARSDNGCATFVLSRVGLERGSEFFQTLTGARYSPDPENAIGFGGIGVAPVKLARAYAIFANGGRLIELTPIASAYHNGSLLTLDAKKESPQVVSAEAAFIVAQSLRSVLGYGFDGASGTMRKLPFARRSLAAGLEVGAKSGSGAGDAWAVSVSPKLVVLVWVGFESGNSKFDAAGSVYASQTAALVWSDFMEAVWKTRPDLLAGKFQQPANVVAVKINPKNGCRAARDGIEEFFIKGTEPGLCSFGKSSNGSKRG